MTHAQLKANALRWANRQRAKQGKEPLKELPKGSSHNGNKCPIANATECRTGVWFQYPHDEVRIALPREVTVFIKAFDNGWYPELEA